MTEKQVLEEYKFLLEEYSKIDREKTKKFCLQGFGIGVGSIALEIITDLEIFSPLFLGGIIYFGTKFFFDREQLFYPISNHSLYKETLQKYKESNKRIAEAISKSKENDPAFITGIYQYLLNAGHFSYNRKIYDSTINCSYFILPQQDLGLHVIEGHCINQYVSNHFKNILNELDITNATLPVFLNDNIFDHLKTCNWNFENELSPESVIEQSTKIDHFLEQQRAKILGNWWLNACQINNSNEVYYIDIMNETFYHKRNKNTLEVPNASSLHKLGFPKKDYTLPIKFLSEKIYSTKENTELAKELLKNNDINNEEASAIYSYGQKYVERNIQDFEKLYESNRDTFIDISSNLSKLENAVQQYREEQKAKIKTRTLNK